MDADLAGSIRRLAPVPYEEIARFAALLRPVALSRGELFIRAGDPEPGFGFVERGLFRFYYLREDGSEATRAFIAEGGFLASRVSMARGEPSPFSAEALEDSTVLAAPRGLAEALGRPGPGAGPGWEAFLAAMIQERLDHKDRRIEGFLTQDAAGRYLDFLEEFPGIEERVRQYHIASYLGISSVSLCRIRARLAREGRLP